MATVESEHRLDPDEAALVGKNVTKLFNQNHPDKNTITALDEVSFSVEENEFVVILGPSGCGKTTLLRVLAGLEDATSGEVYVNGEPIDGCSIERSMVFQRFNLFPWRTVMQNVTFGLEMTGVGKQERRETGQQYIDLVGLEGFEDGYPNELSGGMQQRVGLARALSVDPEILLMDEPFGALDAQTRERLQRNLLKIWEEETKTIIFVTHDIDEAILLADRILVMGINPRQIEVEIDVPFDRPRYETGVEGKPEYQELKNDIWNILEENH